MRFCASVQMEFTADPEQVFLLSAALPYTMARCNNNTIKQVTIIPIVLRGVIDLVLAHAKSRNRKDP